MQYHASRTPESWTWRVEFWPCGTVRCCPMRCARSVASVKHIKGTEAIWNYLFYTLERRISQHTQALACASLAGFQQRSKWTTWLAAVRFSPMPPALGFDLASCFMPWKTCTLANMSGLQSQDQHSTARITRKGINSLSWSLNQLKFQLNIKRCCSIFVSMAVAPRRISPQSTRRAAWRLSPHLLPLIRIEAAVEEQRPVQSICRGKDFCT